MLRNVNTVEVGNKKDMRKTKRNSTDLKKTKNIYDETVSFDDYNADFFLII